MKIIYLFIIALLMSGLASAVPQVIFSDLNITIYNNRTDNATNTGYYQLLGEGLNAVSSFSINSTCDFKYNREVIPMTFSRELQQNETDISILIHSLAINNNLSNKWEECVNNLSVCRNDVGYKGNYTICETNLDICQANKNMCESNLQNVSAQLEQKKQQFLLAVIVAIIGGCLAIYYYKKSVVKTARSPLQDIMVASRR